MASNGPPVASWLLLPVLPARRAHGFFRRDNALDTLLFNMAARVRCSKAPSRVCRPLAGQVVSATLPAPVPPRARPWRPRQRARL